MFIYTMKTVASPYVERIFHTLSAAKKNVYSNKYQTHKITKRRVDARKWSPDEGDKYCPEWNSTEWKAITDIEDAVYFYQPERGTFKRFG